MNAPPTPPADRSEPFRVAVALGDSITAGGTATSRDLNWVSRLTRLIDEAQLTPLRMLNHGVGGNVISPRSHFYAQSGRPSALERYRRDAISHHPDLVLLAYGLNDARAGTPVAQFAEDLRTIITDIQAQTGALVVVISTSLMTGYGDYEPFHHAVEATLVAYNEALRQLARDTGAVFADVFSALGGATWTVDEDRVHLNNLGHALLANRIFEALAQNCPAFAGQSVARRKAFNPWRDESALRQAVD